MKFVCPYICGMDMAKHIQLLSMLKEGSQLLKRMDLQVQKKDYEGLSKTLSRSREVRRRMEVITKKA